MINNTLLVSLFGILIWLGSYSPEIFNTQMSTKKKRVVVTNQKNILLQRIRSPKETEVNLLTYFLVKHKFYDALAVYLEENTPSNMKKMETYLIQLAETNSTLALEYMFIFLENEPNSMIMDSIIQTHILRKEYDKAIVQMMQVKENYPSEAKNKKIDKKIKDVSILYIDQLMKSKLYETLIAFLEKMIDNNSEDNFYTYQLAKLYVDLYKFQEAQGLLDGLEYDDVYAKSAKKLLKVIEKEQNKSYEYEIPLEKHGEHYIVQTRINNVEFRLMIDTGATYVYIDEKKASMLDIIDTINLNTAGGLIDAQLRNADTMQVGDITLHDIEITTAPFERENVDGLLGMNFLNQFTFLIDQEEKLLYLTPK